VTKTEHLQFLVLMIPTFIVLLAAAVSMADLALPAAPATYNVSAVDTVWDDRPAPN
jgi:hypothetical protein